MKLIAPAPGTRVAALGHEYSAKPLLTNMEERFFKVLDSVSGGRVHVVCKPRLADFIQHTDGLAGFNHISQKHVDFLVCRPGDWMPMLGIEVDDSSHNRRDRRARDSFVNNLFAHVGIPLLRIGVQEVDDLQGLVARLTDGWLARCRRLEAEVEPSLKDHETRCHSTAGAQVAGAITPRRLTGSRTWHQHVNRE